MSKDEGIPWELLNIKVPEGVPKETGFFEISGTATSEKVSSRVYAWFLDRGKNPVLAQLFCDALLRVAQEKLDDASVAECLALGNYECELEETTSSQKRIDILLRDTEARLAIIIENKIHADLKNDLLDYWNHVSYPKAQKLGVLLTLHPTVMPEDFKSTFINITHLEWVESIEFARVPSGIPLYTYGMMTDFFNTIRNQSTNKTMNDQARFFFDHPALVTQAHECLKAAMKYIEGELEEMASLLGLSPKIYVRSGLCYLYEGKDRDDAYYKVDFNQLVRKENPEINVILELHSTGIRHMNLLDEALGVLPQSSTIKRSKSIQGRGETKYVHFRAKELSLNADRISQLGEILIKTIRVEFKPLMSIIHKRLDELTNDG